MRFLLFLALAGSLMACAETPDPASPTDGDNPVAQVRNNKSWEYGPFVNFGNGAGVRDDFQFFRAGFQLSKIITRPLHTWPFPGQFEFGGNIMPLWMAFTPAPHYQTTTCVGTDGQTFSCSLLAEGGMYHGVSITPVIFRWNFLTKSKRIQPWFQAAGGVIYTTHKFPPNYFPTQIINGQVVTIDSGTCVWNFSPQGGGGIHYFTRNGRSWDIGVNGVHISSASLGDRNPGVNGSVEVQVGYTFWK
jgi:hypothetical protein